MGGDPVSGSTHKGHSHGTEEAAGHADHTHKVDGQLVRGDIAHQQYGVPLHVDHYHFDSKLGQWIPHGEFHAKGPEAWLVKQVVRFLVRAGLFREPEAARPPIKGPTVPGQEGFKQAEKKGSEAAARLKTIVPAEILQEVAKLKGKGDGEKEWTQFEQVFFGRYAQGKKLGGELPQGKFRYLQKTEGKWTQFFQNFRAFTLEKIARMTDVEGVVIRGLLKTALEMRVRDGKPISAAERAMLISDLKLISGRTEKFVRILLGEGRVASEIMARLSSLTPGEQLTQGELAELINSPEFSYLALSHKIVRPDLAKESPNLLTQSAEARAEETFRYARGPEQGIALSAKTEEIVARQLDLNWRPIAQRGDEVGRDSLATGRGIFSFFRRRRRFGLFGGEEAPILQPGFVPWYQLIFRRRKWKGRPKWYVPLIYFVVASSIALFAFYVFKFLLQR